MSFSFSQNLLDNISSSQGSQSDSSLPPTQPMMGYNMATSSRQNFTLPRPPSCPNMTRNTFSSLSHDQQRGKYSKVENNSSDKAGLGQTLREVQARLSSVPSSCSRMLEEGVGFLEAEIGKEKEATAASVKVVRDIIKKILEFCEAANTEELIEKKNASLKISFEMVETLKEMLIAVDEEQKSAVKVIDIMEERLDQQMKANKELSKEISQLNVISMNMSEVVKKVVKEEVEKMQRKTGQVNNTGWGGAGGRRAAVVRTVRGFSLARRLGKQLEAVVDFSTVMEVDDDDDDDWEE